MEYAVRAEVPPLGESKDTYAGRVVDYGARPILDRIGSWASATPDALAIEYGGATLSYADLLDRIHQCAHWMSEHGVAPGNVVALDLERSPDLVIAMLATWRLGGAFIPLDPSWPARRVQAVLEDAKPALIVHAAMQSGVEYRAEPLRHAVLSELEGKHARGTIAARTSSLDDLAYVLFTSGSTGAPKGVMVEHRQVLNYALAVSETLSLSENKRWSVLGSLAVDLGYTAVFGALLNGACLVIASATDVQDSRAFARFVRERDIDCMKIVPSYLDALLDVDDAVLPRKLILGGEATSPALLERIWSISRDCRVYNHYGPTETTVGVMVHEADRQRDADAVLPLSTVLPNCRVHVLDDERRAVPIGERGEVYVGGAQICRGYLNGQNAGAFDADPWRPGERLYRTGDLAYRLRGGAIRLAGRVDHQVKILGFRVEPAEIETALLEQDGVRQAVVVTGEGGGSENRLTAFIVAEAAVRGDEGHHHLRDAIAARFPAYMRPGTYVLVDELPRLPSGKVDRHALSMRQVIATSQEVIRPRDETEFVILSCMAELLKRDAIAATDDFFALGGNSLLVIKLAARLRKRLGVDISPATVFEHGSPSALAAAIRERSADSQRAVPGNIDVVIRTGSLALSPAQSRQWFLWQLDKSSTAYHTGGALRLKGRLDRDALRCAFEKMSARHESLRTIFRASAEGVVEQLIQPPGCFVLSEFDVRDEVRDAVQARVAEVIQRVARTPFDLTVGPLLRVALIRLSPEDHVLAVVMHHIVSDGWSMQIIVEEFVELYRAKLEGREPALQPLPIQYVDYAVWQRNWLEAGEQERQLAYWRKQLGDEHPVLQLPTDHPRPAEPKYRAASHQFELPTDLVESLRQRAREHRATVFMVLLAGFQALLHRYTGLSNVRIGTTNANRGRPETQGLVGFFVNTQVLCSRVDGQMALGALIEQVREAVIGAQGHADLPFEQLVEVLQPQRDRSHQPLFQIFMDHQQKDFGSLSRLSGLELQRYEMSEQGALFELWMNTVERSDAGIDGTVSYARELFEPRTITQLSERYLSVLRCIADDPQCRVGEVLLRSVREEEQLRQWGVNNLRYTMHEPLHRVIERQVEACPDSVALVFGDEEVSYGNLNLQSNRLAHYLRARGVEPETRVGVAIERSIDLVVALLGILKAGGAYVPLDPDYPPERLGYMIQNSGVGLVLTRRSLANRLPGVEGVIAVQLDALDLGSEPVHNPKVAVHPDNLAYVIHTSGSTGKPKGAANRHGSVYNRLAWMQDAYGLGVEDAVLQKTPFSFDVSVWELFWPLMQGARLVIAEPGAHRDPAELVELICRYSVTTLHFVPSMLRAFLAHEGIEACRSLRRIVCSGEALSIDVQARVFSRLPWARLYNLYGPTEAAIDVTHWTCVDAGGSSVPIGRPIADTRTVVLDDEMCSVPWGIAGELYLGGVGLARGYMSRAGLTAERFVADPLSDTGDRLYRTGDQVRWNCDGQLEYLGRIDHQVKIRGFRIELGEIESQLLNQPELREAVVVAHEHDGDQRLLAYVVPDTCVQSEGADVRSRETLVTQWQSVFDSTYEGEGIAPGFRGWSSSYTDQPIPEKEMQEWLQSTVDRVRRLKPERIFEIGCGVGLLVQHLAPQAGVYEGTDLSARAVKDLRAWINTQPTLSHVQLRQAEASDFTGVCAGQFDTVILNSVAQYFPDIDYLAEALKGAAQIVGSGGRLFIGDLRHLAHVPMFHASVQLYRASAQTTVRQLKGRIQRAISQDRELVLDPEFFHAFAAHLGMGCVEVQLRRGKTGNEMTSYRYDVVIHGTAIEAGSPESFDGSEAGALERLIAHLTAHRPPAATLRAVPNRRLMRDLAAWRLLQSSDERSTVGELLAELEKQALMGVDPETLWVLGESNGYHVQVSWTAGTDDGSLDVSFIDLSAVGADHLLTQRHAELPSSWRSWASDPMRASFVQELGKRLQEKLGKVLPDYMVPAHFTVLDKLPLNSNGKLDRRALPEPEYLRAGNYEAPQGDVEGVLATIWSEVLGVERIGRNDKFFDLGGHSLALVRVQSLVQARMAVQIPLRLYFENASLKEVAHRICVQGERTTREETKELDEMASLLEALEE